MLHQKKIKIWLKAERKKIKKQKQTKRFQKQDNVIQINKNKVLT